MKKLFTFFTAFLSLAAIDSNAQCTVLANATTDITLQCNNAIGQTARSGVAYNPTMNLYYSVDAGNSGYPIETFDASGAYLANIMQGFDYRGLWWNAHTNQLEGNGYGPYGVAYQNLDGGTGYPLGTVTTIFPTPAQPDDQSVGDYDTTNDYIIYYFSGSFYLYHRSDNSSAGTIAITGLPVPTSDLNSNTAFYTGCPGQAYGVYDYVNKAFYFINETTGAYVATSQLPLTAPAASIFNAHYANGKVFLFDQSTYIWSSYTTLQLTPTCPATATALGDTSFCAGDSVSIKANTGTGYTYQWLNNNTTITGATDSIYVATTSGTYSAIVTNGTCFDTSNNVIIVVHTAPTPSIINNNNVLSVASGPYATYAWYKNTSPISGATNATYIVTQNGSYNVTVTDTNGCSGVSNIVIISGLSVQNLNGVADIANIYPNPNTGTFTISGTSGGESLSMSVCDVVGRIIYIAEIPVVNGGYTRQVKLDKNLAPGQYMVKTVSESGNHTLRFIKQ